GRRAAREFRRRRVGLRRRGRLPVVETIGRYLLRVVRLVAEEGELRARCIEREVLVVAASGVERLDRAVRDVARVGAVLCRVGRRDRVRDPVTVRVPVVFGDLGDGGFFAAAGQLGDVVLLERLERRGGDLRARSDLPQR